MVCKAGNLREEAAAKISRTIKAFHLVCVCSAGHWKAAIGPGLSAAMLGAQRIWTAAGEVLLQVHLQLQLPFQSRRRSLELYILPSPEAVSGERISIDVELQD